MRGSPAIAAFVELIKPDLEFAQVWLSRAGNGFALRHMEDRHEPNDSLRLLQGNDLREWVQSTENNQFRPLKSAPNLRRGWRVEAADESDLEAALREIYPGALGDWHTWSLKKVSPVSFREFVNRQSGMYRITAKLTDAQAAPAIRATCHKRFCLKQRLWSVPGLDPDPQGEKSLIPCLEPCAILLEFARRAMRIEQEEKIQWSASPSDLLSLQAGLEHAAARPNPEVKEADFMNPANPRRVQLALEKWRSQMDEALEKNQDFS